MEENDDIVIPSFLRNPVFAQNLCPHHIVELSVTHYLLSLTVCNTVQSNSFLSFFCVTDVIFYTKNKILTH